MSIPNGIKVAGKIEPIDCPYNVRFSRVGGQTWRYSFRGLAQEVYAKFWARASAATEGEYSQGDGEATARATLVYQSPQDGAIERAPETLEVDFHEISGSIFLNPTYLDIDADRIKAIQRVVSVAQDPESTAEQVTAKIAAEAITGDELGALDLLMRGVSEYTWQVPILTYTRTVSSLFQAQLGLTTAGMIWNQDRVGSYLGAKAILFALDDVNDGFGGIGSPAGFARGWMHKAKLNAIANGSWQMTEIFEFGAWPVDLYPPDNFTSPL